MAVDLRTGVPVLPICRRLVEALVVLVADPADRAAARMTNMLHRPTGPEMVRRARCEVAYNSALRGAGGMRRVLPRASV
jgi:gamma-glutamyl-gamma-aminobutyrate hydrolase PuuD